MLRVLLARADLKVLLHQVCCPLLLGLLQVTALMCHLRGTWALQATQVEWLAALPLSWLLQPNLPQKLPRHLRQKLQLALRVT